MSKFLASYSIPYRFFVYCSFLFLLAKNLLFGSIIMIYISTLVVALKLIIQHNENYPV
nr:MAG TPA: hypothetical protein [Caudoviricetes sp.]